MTEYITLTYKGYTGVAKYDHYDGLYYGEVANLRDVVTFQGANEAGLQQALIDSIDDYEEKRGGNA